MTGCQINNNNEIIKPPWLRVRALAGERVDKLRHLLDHERLNTVCYSAACPNIGECWNNGVATFMILGNQCTRSCRFCNVPSEKRPLPVDLKEPERLLKSALAMDLKHVVITSVARDDLADGGASQFARCLKLLKNNAPHLTSEVLTPDFFGIREHLKIVLDEGPTIFNHNIETVARLTPRIRSKALYDRSLQVLKMAKELSNTVRTKSGIMVGLGEEDEEVSVAMKDLREHKCDHLTIGQYLRPSAWHEPVHRYVHPDQFLEYKNIALALGFKHVESGPLVRSSYHAHKAV
jgi:lipoic acid synthetase